MEHWSDTTQLQKATPSENESDANELIEQPVDAELSESATALDVVVAIDAADQNGASAPPTPHPPLTAFPKEFNKSYLEALDRRYVAILLLTLIIEPLLIWYLLRTHPLALSEQAVAKLQNRYADLFLSEFKVENETPVEMPTDILSHAAEAVPKILEGVAGGGAAGRTNLNLPGWRGPSGNTSPEARGWSGENREAVRRLHTITRQRGRQALAEEVERIGLLGVITSGGSDMVSRAPITDILEYADSTMGDIDQALAQVRELRIPRAGVDYFGQSLDGGSGWVRRGNGGSDDDVFIAHKEVRGKRATSSGVAPEDIVTGLAVASQKAIQRNQQFEQVAAAPALIPTPGLAGLRSRPTNGHATRDREKIREVVLAHNPAIQDCYRRQLKGNAALKGKVTVRFTINPMGYVVYAEIVSADMAADGAPLALPEMEECILTKIRKWRDFGQVEESQGEITFRQTYNFGY